MKTSNRITRGSLRWAGLLGAALLVAAPMSAGAQQAKWWTPKESRGPRRGVETTRIQRTYVPGWQAGERRVWRAHPAYGRVYRDYVVVRDGSRGPYFRARRYYVQPSIFGHVYIVRPVRWMVAADARIGGLMISALFHPRAHEEFGCNFCGERFDTYDDYAEHVSGCPDRPRGYSVQPRAWDDGDSGSGGGDQGWQNDDDE